MPLLNFRTHIENIPFEVKSTTLIYHIEFPYTLTLLNCAQEIARQTGACTYIKFGDLAAVFQDVT